VSIFDCIKRLLTQTHDIDVEQVEINAVSGGDIHQSFHIKVNSDHHDLFIKANLARHANILRSEYNSLEYLQSAQLNNYPKPILFKEMNGYAFLIMHHHSLTSLDAQQSTQLGIDLSTQHQISNDRFGWYEDNYIGLTPQYNSWDKSWIGFFRDQRLLPQLKMAVDNGLSTKSKRLVETVMKELSDYIDEPGIKPALVHGDLWSGNVAYDYKRNKPLFFDPAPYFGDPEVDIAMTELFAGFHGNFYQSYEKATPLNIGCSQRKRVYNLYHALNHVNLFGTMYESMVKI